MDALLDLAAPYAPIFWLTAARLTPLAPNLFPRAAGLLPRFALVAGATVYFTIVQGPRPVPDAAFVPALVLNFLIGTVMSVGLQIVFGLWLSLGEAFDALRAPSPAPVEVPGAQLEASPTAAMFALLGVVYFLSVAGPAHVAQALGHQLRHLPPEAPWAFFAHAGWLSSTLHLAAVLFSTVALFTLPLVFVLLFLEFSVGFVGVWLPQTPSYFLMMPVRSFVALLLLFVLNPLILEQVGNATLWMVQRIMILS
jgi:flagellar biosynthesis protein FliR